MDKTLDRETGDLALIPALLLWNLLCDVGRVTSPPTLCLVCLDGKLIKEGVLFYYVLSNVPMGWYLPQSWFKLLGTAIIQTITFEESYSWLIFCIGSRRGIIYHNEQDVCWVRLWSNGAGYLSSGSTYNVLSPVHVQRTQLLPGRVHNIRSLWQSQDLLTLFRFLWNLPSSVISFSNSRNTDTP